jgi:hypothetical protein
LTADGVLEQIKHSEFTVDQFLGPHEPIDAFRKAEQLAIEQHLASGASHDRKPDKSNHYCCVVAKTKMLKQHNQ